MCAGNLPRGLLDVQDTFQPNQVKKEKKKKKWLEWNHLFSEIT